MKATQLLIITLYRNLTHIGGEKFNNTKKVKKIKAALPLGFFLSFSSAGRHGRRLPGLLPEAE
jgi:hypothetical protein